MASLGGAVFPSAAGRRGALHDTPLFEALVASAPLGARRRSGGTLTAGISLVTHAILLTLAVVLPILWPAASPETTDYIRALIYNPPPPPPPPLPKGSALIERKETAKPVTPEPQESPKTDALVEPQEQPLQPEPRPDESEQTGSPTGSDSGVAEGSEEGVDGGVVGGVPGGVLGGVVGGTGDGPVMDYDQPPRPIKMPRPQYPQEAFVKKIEGTVIVEILINSEGRVSPRRIIQSIPALDSAAVEAVKQWLFSPAIKRGRPVPTVAHAPVAFRIY
jgi:protein TonB